MTIKLLPFSCKEILLAIFLLFALAGCQAAAGSLATATPLPDPTSTVRPSTTPPSTHIPVPTNTSEPTNTPLPSPTPDRSEVTGDTIIITTQDGLAIAADIHYPASSTDRQIAIIFAHESSSNRQAWEDFAAEIVPLGYTALLIDHRGYGDSDGTKGFQKNHLDVIAAAEYLKLQGFTNIACFGASMGGSACLAAAKETEFSGLAMLSSPMNVPGTRLVSTSDLKNMLFPKVIMIAEEDFVDISTPGFIDGIIKMGESMPEPVTLKVYPGGSHGVALLYDQNGDDARVQLMTLLDNIEE